MLPAILLIGPLKEQLSKVVGPEGGPEGLLGDLTKLLPKVAFLEDIRAKLPKP